MNILLNFTFIILNLFSLLTALEDGIYAIVGKDIITKNELSSRIYQLQQAYEKRGETINAKTVAKIKQEALDSLINESIKAQFVLDYNISISDEQIDIILSNQAAMNNMTLNQLKQYHLANGTSIETLKENLRQNYIEQNLHNHITQRRSFSKEEIQDFIESHNLTNQFYTYEIEQMTFTPINTSVEAENEALSAANEYYDQLQSKTTASELYIQAKQEKKDNVVYGDDSITDALFSTRFSKYKNNASNLNKQIFNVILSNPGKDILKPIKSGTSYIVIKIVGKQLDAKTAVSKKLHRLGISTLTKDAKASLRDIMQDIDSLEDFEKAVIKYSHDEETVGKRGDLGWVVLDHLPKEVSVELKYIPNKSLSSIIKQDGLFYIYWVEDTKKIDIKNLDVENIAKQLLAKKHEEESIAKWYETMRESYFIKILNEQPQTA